MVKLNLIQELFLNHIEAGYADRVMFVRGDLSFSYLEIYTRIKKVAGNSYLKNITKGNLVAVYIQDPVETVVVFFALIYLGLIPCILNPSCSIKAYSDELERARCVAIIEQELPSDSEPEAMNFNEVAFGLFTSGTTGHQTLVYHRHSDAIFMNENYGRNILKLSETDRLFTTSRFYFAYGLNVIFFSLLNKSVLIIPEIEITPHSVMNELLSQRPTVLFSVPTFYKRMLVNIQDKIALQFFRLCISAGEQLPQPIFENWKKLTGISILDGIGTTETLSTFISNRPNDTQPGCTGTTVPGFITQVRHIETGEPVKSGEIGILWVKGDTYIPYYPTDALSTTHRFIDGWFKTNDLFSEDEKGYYYNHGRVNDLIKVSGIWIYPYKIEEALASHNAVSEVVVTGVKDPDGLMRIQAQIVLNASYEQDDELSRELKSWSKQKLSQHEYPHYIHYVSTIPKTPSGKIIRRSVA